MFVTQENAVDVHSLGKVLTFTTTLGGKQDPDNHISPDHCLTFPLPANC